MAFYDSDTMYDGSGATLSYKSDTMSPIGLRKKKSVSPAFANRLLQEKAPDVFVQQRGEMKRNSLYVSSDLWEMIIVCFFGVFCIIILDFMMKS